MYKLSSLLILFFLFSCGSPKEDSYILEASNDSLVFDLNPQTSMFIKALFPYTDEKGRPDEWLTQSMPEISPDEQRRVYREFLTRRLANSKIFTDHAITARKTLI